METDHVNKWGNQLERSSWTLVFFGMMTQVSTEYAFPSYNVALGFWGAHCSYGCHGRSTFGLLSFLLLGCVLDAVFLFSNTNDSPIFKFQVVMLIFSLLTKCYSLFCGSHFFAAIGGAYAMDPRHMRSGQPGRAGAAVAAARSGSYERMDE